jgi:glycosyltransferase involved in cell wall biosynthesis
MVSVIIATLDSERVLVPTLAALVAGAADGLVREVTVADGGSRDATREIADAAGCRILTSADPTGTRLRRAAAQARAPWLLFLRPGAVPQPDWVAEVARFLERGQDDAAAVFRRSPGSERSDLREALSLLLAALVQRPGPDQGLLIAKTLYERLGGHSPAVSDPETDLLRRITRKRLVVLRTGCERRIA